MHHILCGNPFISRDFYAIRPPILWHILGAYFLLIWGVGVVKIIFNFWRIIYVLVSCQGAHQSFHSAAARPQAPGPERPSPFGAKPHMRSAKCWKAKCQIQCITPVTIHLVAPYCAIRRDYLSDTPYCALWGFWCLNMANWVRYPLALF